MKTTKLILSIALVALATVSVGGQRTYILERLISNDEPQIAQLTADNEREKSRIEIWKHNFNGWASEKFTWDVYEAPKVAHTFYAERVEVVHEENLELEKWMTRPFKDEFVEEEVRIESWMARPFKDEFIEEELYIESWMTTPIESVFPEEELNVESWMTTPFEDELEDPVEVETWMATAWI